MKRLLALALLAGCGPSEPSMPVHARRWISEERVRQDVRILAGPDFEGRGPADAGGGEERTAAWIATRFQSLGLRTDACPFLVSLREPGRDCGVSWPGGSLGPGPDLAPLAVSASARASGQLVRGLAARISWDVAALRGFVALEEIDQIPARGRHLSPTLGARALLYQQLGAVAVVFVAHPQDPTAAGEAALPALGDLRATLARQARVPKPSRALTIPAVVVSRQGFNPAFADAALIVEVSASFAESGEPSSNVVAELAGLEPVLSAVVVSAHFDHHGRDASGAVHPGACDNAAGVAALLAVAEAFAAAPHRPRRTVLFCAFGAEERGLHGSRAWVAETPAARARILADINMDMLGRNDPARLWIVGAVQNPELTEIAKRGLASAGLDPRTGIDFAFPNGSDHWPFHEAGIPAITLTCSRFPENEKPGDTWDKLDYAAVAAGARAAFATAWELANREDPLPAPRDITVKFPGEK